MDGRVKHIVGASLLERLDALPPWACRVLAHRLTISELADKAGLPFHWVQVLSRAESWRHYPVSVIVAYTEACGVDLLHVRSPMDRLRKLLLKPGHVPRFLRGPQRKKWMSILDRDPKWRSRR